MIKILENIYALDLYKMLLKIISFVIAGFIIFNSVFSPLLMNVNSNDLSKFSVIQKDVFSAVFFVSNTIEKINFSLTSKLIANDNEKQNSQDNKNNTKPYNYNDFIIIANSKIQNEELKIQALDSAKFVSYALTYVVSSIINLNYNFYENEKIYLCMLLLLMFFLSIKKIYYNNIELNINRISPLIV